MREPIISAAVVFAVLSVLAWIVVMAKRAAHKKSSFSLRVGDKVTVRGAFTTGTVRGITQYNIDGGIRVWVTPEYGYIGADLAQVEPYKYGDTKLEEIEVMR